MLKQIESYIEVLKDRIKLVEEYRIGAGSSKRDYYFYIGQRDLLDDIIAELEGFVKVEAMLDKLMLAKLSGVGPSTEDHLYDEDGWPEPADDQMSTGEKRSFMDTSELIDDNLFSGEKRFFSLERLIPSTGPSLDTADGKGDYTKTEKYESG